MSEPIRLPYFDTLLALLERGDPIVTEAFGDHVHWGYWPDPAAATRTPDDFRAAAERLSQLVYAAAEITGGQRILDTGCGLGGTIASLNRTRQDLDLIGLNIEHRQLRRAQGRRSSPGNQFAWIQGNASRLPFADASFDAVLAVECIFHFPSRDDFFREARRVLKPGGRLAISDFLPVGLARPFMPLARATFSFYGNCDFACTREEYRGLAERHGLRAVIERDITAETLPTYPFLRRLAVQTSLRGIPAKRLAAAFETFIAEWVSRTRLVRYFVLSWQRVD